VHKLLLHWEGGEDINIMTALKRGFTLIELLIVIAILGVLAVVVLVAINPVQQLARTRDAGRMSTVAQLGHAAESYYTSHNGVYPPDFATLVTSGEINNIPSQVTNTLTSMCSGATDTANGWCYDMAASSFAIFSALEADTNLTIGTCTGTAHAAYLSLAGKGCIVCAAPGAATDVTACEND